MASLFQSAVLFGAPSYPNAIAWSDENLIAVASGHLVTILNPALPSGPRGLVTVDTGEPFPIGVVDRDVLMSDCLLPTILSRDIRPCVRSISWSPLGLAPNAGCLLAVCTTEGRVKVYRPPYCDFGAEWVEVLDISCRFCDYLQSIGFGDLEICSYKETEELAADNESTHDLSNSVLRKDQKRRKVTSRVRCCNRVSGSAVEQFSYTEESKNDNTGSDNKVSASKHMVKKKVPETCTLPLITAEKYASRSAMLSSLVLSWSPVLHLSPKVCSVPQTSSSIALLAIGGKSGKVSLWRVSAPECYSIDQCKFPTTAVIVGLLQAHESWITAISWAMLDYDSSKVRIIIATGSSDGSVRIWMACSEELLNSTEANHASFSLLKEVEGANSLPVSVLSIAVSAKSSNEIFLAVGRGSGSFEVWICDISSNKFESAGPYDAHNHIVTGLSWAHGGHTLYSCSQDNSVRSWILNNGVLCEVQIPTNAHLNEYISKRCPYMSCFGFAVSPGNIAISMVRNFDEESLNPMYEKRVIKASVEFFWIGSPKYAPDCILPRFSEKELVYWETNILWSLKQYESPNKPLMVWDIIAMLMAFKHSTMESVESILVKWLSISYVGSHEGLSAEKVLSYISKTFSKISSRQLHLLNIICRRVILSDLKADQINCKFHNLEELHCTEEEKLIMWIGLLSSCERELRERLVGCSFSTFTTFMRHSASFSTQSRNLLPAGLAQMEQWVALNHDNVSHQLRVLASDVRKQVERLQASEYMAKEQCSYCSASVSFESPEVALCQSVGQGHKLARCAVSMEVCPLTPLWFCVCCHRRVFRLAPETLFALPGYPLDFKSQTKRLTVNISSKPLCPFCGILLLRPQPDFLLCASPVPFQALPLFEEISMSHELQKLRAVAISLLDGAIKRVKRNEKTKIIEEITFYTNC